VADPERSVGAKKMDGVDDAYDKHGGYDQVMMIRIY